MMPAVWNSIQRIIWFQTEWNNPMASIRKILNIRELDLETEAFQKYFNDMLRKRGETLTKIHKCGRDGISQTAAHLDRSHGRRKRQVQ